MNDKKKYGRFYTTNYTYILKGMYIPDDIKIIIEPFVGDGDLLNFISDKNKYTIEQYDINPDINNAILRDTLLNTPDYNNKFILTNPPFLASNKSKHLHTDIYNKYNVDDLYKCFIKSILNYNPIGGIIIIPINFWSSTRNKDNQLRRTFLNKFNVIRLNLFEIPVFKDTSIPVCCFQFQMKHNNNITDNNIETIIYPSNKTLTLKFNNDNDFNIGGEIHKLKTNDTIKVNRLTRKTNYDTFHLTNIYLKAVDDNNPIGLYYTNDPKKYMDHTIKLSCRNYASIVINKKLNNDQQIDIITKFNKLLGTYRLKYNSLFMTNYRNGSRKRIEFKLVYKLINYLYNQSF